MDGMSGQRYRSFINALMRELGDGARYLEIGVWKGSTLAAAIEGNRGFATCIDNWSSWGGPREEFNKSLASVVTSTTVTVIDKDFRSVDYASTGPYNLFLYDGPHSERDQYDAIMLAKAALASPAVLIVDDWNWPEVRLGTFRALVASKCQLLSYYEIRSTPDNSFPHDHCGRDSDWHNGYFMGVTRFS